MEKKHDGHHPCRTIIVSISEFCKTTLVLLWLVISDVIDVQLRYIQAPQEMIPCSEVPAKTYVYSCTSLNLCILLLLLNTDKLCINAI